MRFSYIASLGVAGLVAASTTFAAAPVSPPVFSPSPNVGWIAYGTDFLPPVSGPGPITADPAHPFIPDPVEYRAAQPNRPEGPAQSTFRVADLSNPILQPWAREELRKVNERVLAGRPGYRRQTACWPNGTPGYLLYPVQPVFFVQSPKEIVTITQYDQQIRRIYMNVPHSAQVKPSWYGESVGHYEGDELVVDTIGISTKAYVDNYRTPHTDKLHVIERYRLIEGGQIMEVSLRIEDPGTFTMPWSATQRYRRVEPGPLLEMYCAENNSNYFNHDVDPMPEEKTPGF